MKIAYALPEKILANDNLVKIYPEWTAEKIFAKTGIASRHVAGDGETALVLAERAARGLFSLHGVTSRYRKPVVAADRPCGRVRQLQMVPACSWSCARGSHDNRR